MGAVTEAGDGTVNLAAAALQAGTDLLLCGPDPAAQVRVEAGLALAFANGELDVDEAAASAGRLANLQAWLAEFDRPSIEVVGCAEHWALADELARRSITLIRDRDGLVPLRLAPGTRILVIEPRPRDLTPADTTSSLAAGGLLAAIRERHARSEGRIVEAAVGTAEIAALGERARSVDLVVLGTVDALREPSVGELARALVATGTPTVAVALRGPWDADAYLEIGTVLATYGIQTPSLVALATALVGDAPISGRVPVRLRTIG
jgi:beta-N-acetylhexosaminidase